MSERDDGCRYCAGNFVHLTNMRNDMAELKNRVHGLEATLGRGVMLLVANLVGIAILLARHALQL